MVNGSDPFAERNFNAVPMLAYYDIFKNYYANKQEDKFYIRNYKNIAKKIVGWSKIENGSQNQLWVEVTGDRFTTIRSMSKDTEIRIEVDEDISETDLEAKCEIYYAFLNKGVADNLYNFKWTPLTKFCKRIAYDSTKKTYTYRVVNTEAGRTSISFMGLRIQIGRNTAQALDDIDSIREDILATPGNRNWTFQSREGQEDEIPFMNFLMNQSSNNKNGGGFLFSPEWGLVTKTYQSDLCQNWINTEWLDGDDGINQITAVAVEDGKFTIDALNLANKVYNYLNRIAVSDGSYRSWLETTWTGSYTERTETPIYCGGSSAEIIFQEVVSTSAATDEPLGTLAGRGIDSNHKGGYVTVRATEPGYLIGITSITPRLDYTQGNQWDVNLDSIDDLHKPALDGIGFQDLSSELLHAGTTQINTLNDTITQKFIGKQPAWIDYMTNINRAYGNFRTNESFMILSRQYSLDYQKNIIKDLTTYIDPELYNGIFADQSFDAQNFWVQIGVEIEARRLMSAKIIPNL
nr:MAG TPA: Major capsid protein [Microviridae sp.]